MRVAEGECGPDRLTLEFVPCAFKPGAAHLPDCCCGSVVMVEPHPSALGLGVHFYCLPLARAQLGTWSRF